MEIVNACIYFTRALKLKGLNISRIKSHVIIFIDTTAPHMGWAPHTVGPTPCMWGPPHVRGCCITVGPISCERLLYHCCVGVIHQSSPNYKFLLE
jgi:hypothetical protein